MVPLRTWDSSSSQLKYNTWINFSLSRSMSVLSIVSLCFAVSLLAFCLPLTLMCLFCVHPAAYFQSLISIHDWQKMLSCSRYLLRTLRFLWLETGGRNTPQANWQKENQGCKLRGVRHRALCLIIQKEMIEDLYGKMILKRVLLYCIIKGGNQVASNTCPPGVSKMLSILYIVKK